MEVLRYWHEWAADACDFFKCTLCFAVLANDLSLPLMPHEEEHLYRPKLSISLLASKLADVIMACYIRVEWDRDSILFFLNRRHIPR